MPDDERRTELRNIEILYIELLKRLTSHNEEDPFVKAMDRFKKRSFATFGALLLVFAIFAVLLVEAVGTKKVWDVLFLTSTTHIHSEADPIAAGCNAYGSAAQLVYTTKAR